MTDCRGKDSSLVFILYYSCFPENTPLDTCCTLTLSDMSPVGTAQQTDRWAAPAPTHGEKRGWLLPTGKSRTPPPRTTRRWYCSINLSTSRQSSLSFFLFDHWAKEMFDWSSATAENVAGKKWSIYVITQPATRGRSK